MNDVLKARVLNGAAWLDETYPGWWKSIDLGLLDMSSGANCVLGQVFSGHLSAVEQDQMVCAVAASASMGSYNMDSRADWERRARTWGGFSILVAYHCLTSVGHRHGFVIFNPFLVGALGDEWTQLIISYRMQAQPDIDELIEAVRTDRELVAA